MGMFMPQNTAVRLLNRRARGKKANMESLITSALITALFVGFAGLLKLILNHLEKQREGFETFLANHMSKNTEALEEVTDALRDLAAEVKGRR